MITPARTSLLVLLTAAATACGTAPASESTSGRTSLPGNNSTSGTVLTGPDLYEHGGTLLRYLYARIPGMTVDYGSPVCPRVHIRGRKSIMGSSDPIVYVDGARTANSCILADLHTRDLSRVEIYPMGVSNRPGYEAHPNGLILVFLRDGTEPDMRSRLSD
jgi:hypothetical protein